MIDCETSAESVNAQKFGGHDEPVDEYHACYAIEIYDESLEVITCK